MLVILALIVIDIYILLNTGNKSLKNSKKDDDKKIEWTVYGTSWCGWTTKQLEYLKKKNIPYKFIDCEKGNCDGIEAFPVMKNSKGEKVVGYKEV